MAVRSRNAKPPGRHTKRQGQALQQPIPKSGGRNVGEKARPFVKWAGGKRQLLSEIISRFPKSYGTYHEPFVGGGAVFFSLVPQRAYLSDQNERLVRAYCGIRNSVDQVIAHLSTYKNERTFYLESRHWDIDSRPDAEVAAWLIFLNKTGFNGLYRVNSKNQFNVPFGNNPRATVCDVHNLRLCSAALATAEIHCEDFSSVRERARTGDLVYFDPPYVPVSITSYFTSYTARGFTMSDHIRLRDLAVELRLRGVHVIISNSSSSVVYDLYKDFTCVPVLASRLVNATTSGRGTVTELLIF